LLIVVALVMTTVGATAGASDEKATNCFGRTPTIWGTNFGETIWGTSGKDVIWAGGGNDTIYGLGGNDYICGGKGNDWIEGGGGKDRIKGQGGSDTIWGDNGNDKLIGNGGADFLYGGSGNDVLKGGGGNDYLDGSPGISDKDIGGSGWDDCFAGDWTILSCENLFGGGGPGPGPGGSLDWTLPASKTASLVAGFSGDPRTWNITSGGSVDVFADIGCAGYAQAAPDFELSYTSGAFNLLRFYWIANSFGDDAVLVINAPDAQWYCNDDSWGGLNPTIDFNNPMTGTYDVWVGSRFSGDFDSGTLFVTEVVGNHP
jgi:hypothetical protein